MNGFSFYLILTSKNSKDLRASDIQERRIFVSNMITSVGGYFHCLTGYNRMDQVLISDLLSTTMRLYSVHDGVV